MSHIVDLSHPVTTEAPCSFRACDAAPRVQFVEANSHGLRFITSRLDNLYSNICTHIDLPGHLRDYGVSFCATVGSYDISRFVGDVAVIDVRHKLNVIADRFAPDGTLSFKPTNYKEVARFLSDLESLKISRVELQDSLKELDTAVEDLRGVILYSGLSHLWCYEFHESWNYAYFFSPYLSEDACAFVREAKLSFIGCDAFHTEHPIVNFSSDDLPIVLHPDLRRHVVGMQSGVRWNHDLLLSADVLLYENLNVPASLAGSVVAFCGVPLNIKIGGLNDNALVRPFATVS